MTDPTQPNEQAPSDTGLTPPAATPGAPASAPVPPYAAGYRSPAYPPSPYGAGYGAPAPQQGAGYPAPPAYPGAQPPAAQAPAGYGQPAGYGAPYGYAAYPAAARTNALAITSLVSSVAGLALSWTGVFLLGLIVGIVTGHIALSQIARTGEKGRGMALAGLIIGWASVGLGVLLAVAVVLFIGIGASAWGTVGS